MGTNTIEELFEHRMIASIKFFCKKWDFVPKNTEELFDFLDEHSQTFAATIIEDMILWAGDEFWFNEITSSSR